MDCLQHPTGGYIRPVSVHNASFGIWHLTDYIWQHLRIGFWGFLQINKDLVLRYKLDFY